MSEVNAKSFLGLLQKSGLCEQSELRATLNQLSRLANGKPVGLDQLTDHLLQSGLVSEWHVKKILAGKYKGFFLGKYRLIRHLGTGGMSTVYLAQHTIFNQERAIKVLPRSRVDDKSYLERFYREGRAAASLNHRNIVRVYDIDNDNGTFFLVMEYVKGKDISELVKEGGPLDYEKAIDYTVQCLTGLQHAHDNNLVHRDIKPANLLVAGEGEVKILDLGLAMFCQDDTSLTVMHNERVLGTADYLSPEQAVNSHNIDHRSDIYSAGCTLYYMLTGKPPFHEGSLAQRIAMHQTQEPQDILEFRSDCPDELRSIVQRMMKKKPDDRFQTCDHLVAALRGVSESLFSVPVKTARSPVGVDDSQQPGNKTVDMTRTESPSGSVKSLQKKDPAAAQPVRKQSGKQAGKPANAQSSSRANSTPVSATNTSKRDRGEKVSHTKNKDRRAVKAKAGKSGEGTRQETRPVRKNATADVEQREPKTSANPAAKATAPPNNQKSGGTSQTPDRLLDVGKKPSVENAELSIVVPDNKADTGEVGVRELSQFVSSTRSNQKRSVKPRRKPIRNQMLLASMVIGMLVLLGIVLVIAMNLVSPDEEEKSSRFHRLINNVSSFASHSDMNHFPSSHPNSQALILFEERNYVDPANDAALS